MLKRACRILIVPLLITFNLFCIAEAFSGAYTLSAEETVFGLMRSYTIRDDKETLIDLSFQYNLGYNEISDANPGVDPWYPGSGTRIIIPTSWILPDIPDTLLEKTERVIVINLAEMRLYFIKKTDSRIRVITFPIGIGREGFNTPTGLYRIIDKLKDPVWVIPPSIKDEYPELPSVVPPGPDNPLGSYALRLSNPEYLIHGTNKPLGIGRRVSHGCIRMYPEDIKRLYTMVHIGDRVYITYQSVKIGRKNREIYIEVHKDYLNKENQLQSAINLLRRKGLLDEIDTEELYRSVNQKLGIPTVLKNKAD